MQQVVESIRRVATIMQEISAASREQSAGVVQVGEAVTEMDQVIQQNAALVEEMAASARSCSSRLMRWSILWPSSSTDSTDHRHFRQRLIALAKKPCSMYCKAFFDRLLVAGAAQRVSP